jgi:hypothetical protein
MGRHPSEKEMKPLMVAAVTELESTDLMGIHRTFLLPDGSAKAALEPNKMSLGPIRGGGVALAPLGPHIAVSEGIETGLSFMQATSIPTCAALSAAGIKALVLPTWVREVVVAADPDQIGVEAAQTAAQRWYSEGRKIRIVVPPNGHDFNDLARAA